MRTEKISMNKILIIDDDTGLCELLSEYLTAEGFSAITVNDGAGGVKLAASENFDLIILDVMLPEMNGFETLRHIRASMGTPVIMLTARGEEIDRIVGLEMGADDYLSKPFNPRELIARIRAVLRRIKADASDGTGCARHSKTLTAGNLEMEVGARKVLCGGRPVELTSVEFCILELLLRNAGEMVTRETLFKVALGRDSSAYDRSIDVHVSKLRKKLDAAEPGVDRIKTIRNAGYLYVLDTAKAEGIL